MKYTTPTITGTLSALRAIQSDKGPVAEEQITGNFTNNPSYQADE
jgi:hypothetical protein